MANSTELGNWSGDDLKGTAKLGVGIGADAGLPDEIRFKRNVIELLRRRNSQQDATSDPKSLAIFLLKPNASSVGVTTQRIPMLNNGLTVLCGRMWFYGAGPASGHFIDQHPTDDDALFKYVEDDLKLGECAAVIYDPRPHTPEIRFYPSGLKAPDNYEELSLETAVVDYEKVQAVIDAVYKSNLISPDAGSQNVLWEDADKNWPRKNAEITIQGYLKAGLAGHFLTCTIRDEQKMPEGRLDLEIEQSDPINRSQITRHAVLELKVLRSFGETGSPYSDKYNKEWVESGVTQAAAYQKSKGMTWSALFCFDMRKSHSDQACFTHVQTLASQLGVAMRCWHLFSSTEALQKHSVAVA